MLSIAAGTRILVASGATDMRKGFDGLQGLYRQKDIHSGLGKTIRRSTLCG